MLVKDNVASGRITLRGMSKYGVGLVSILEALKERGLGNEGSPLFSVLDDVQRGAPGTWWRCR